MGQLVAAGAICVANRDHYCDNHLKAGLLVLQCQCFTIKGDSGQWSLFVLFLTVIKIKVHVV